MMIKNKIANNAILLTVMAVGVSCFVIFGVEAAFATKTTDQAITKTTTNKNTNKDTEKPTGKAASKPTDKTTNKNTSKAVNKTKDNAADKKPQKVSTAPDSIRKEYAFAKAYHKYLKKKKANSYRENWLTGITYFRNAFTKAPKHDLAPDCLFQAAVMYAEVYKLHNEPRDLDDAIAKFEDVASLYPTHQLAGEALFQSATLQYSGKHDRDNATQTLNKIISMYGKSELSQKAAAELDKIKKAPPPVPAKPTQTAVAHTEKNSSAPAKPSGDKPANVLEVRHGSTKYYTRITIETSAPVSYVEHLLPSRDGSPPRLYLDLANSHIDPKATAPMKVDDGLLTQVRSAQFAQDTVRVVLDTKSLADYQISFQENPFRILVDIWGKGKGGKEHKEVLATVPKEQSKKNIKNKISLPQQLGLHAKRIVVDPGHGGKDPGAVGADGLLEKNIVLKLGLYAAERLRDKGFEVIMTRNRDVFLSLEERTEIANTSGADLFVSVHINSAANTNAQGIETYYLSLAATPEEMQAAATENKTSAKKLSDLQAILKDLMQNSKVNESAKLAAAVQDNLVKGLGRKYSDVNSLGVKKAPFIVLIGAQMPAVLTEVSFLSNPTEASRLTSDAYLREAADNLTAGITRYAGELSVASLSQL